MKLKVIIKEKLQRKLVDFSRKFSTLKSVIDQMFLDLSVQQLLPKNIVALDLFARNGLWLSKDCEQHSNYLELCEIDEFFYNWSKKSIKANAYNLGDSIEMLKQKSYLKISIALFCQIIFQVSLVHIQNILKCSIIYLIMLMIMRY